MAELHKKHEMQYKKKLFSLYLCTQNHQNVKYCKVLVKNLQVLYNQLYNCDYLVANGWFPISC